MKTATLLIVLACATVGVGPGHAQPPPAAPASAAHPAMPASGVTPAEAQQVLDMLNDPARRAQFIGTLEAVVKAIPAGPAAPPAKAAATPAAATAVAPSLAIAPDSLGAQVVREGEQHLAILSDQVLDAARAFTDFPMLWRWARGIAADRSAQQQLVRAGWRLLLALGLGLAAERLVVRLLRRARRMVYERGPENPADAPAEDENHGESAEAAAEAGETEHHRRRHPSALALMRRIPFALLALILDLIPLGVFLACAYAVLALVAATPNTRLAILEVVDAYVTWRLVLCLTRMFAAPAAPRIRLVHMADATAAYVFRWVRLIVGVAVFGRALAEVAVLYGLHPAAGAALLKMFMLAAHLLLAAVVLHERRAIAERIRAAPDRTSAIARLRNLLAGTWHYIAVFLILALWLIWAFEMRNGYSRLLRVCLATAAILVGSRLLTILLFGLLDRSLHVRPDVAARFPELPARARRYHPILRGFVAGLIGVITILVLCESWGLEVRSWFAAGALGWRAAWALLISWATIVVAVLVWEGVNISMLRHLRMLTEGGEGTRAARLRTLLPIVRAVLLITVGLLAGLTAMAEIGVNIGPLLAGAGILGVAVGFGSQKLVQDFITGIFLLFENAMQVGDLITVAGLSGTVEKLSIRTIRLRGADGSVYIIPFSSVTTVNNTNRGLGNAAVSVNVSSREDTDRVGRVLQEIAAEMRREPAFERRMLGELELWGVDKVEGASVTITGQIVCTDAGRWPVQREFNRRMKMRFQELGIEIPNPTHTVLLQPDFVASAGSGRDDGVSEAAPSLAPTASGSRP